MPRTVTKSYTLFSIDELSEKAKQKAIEKHRAFMYQQSHYSEYATAAVEEKLEALGLPTNDVRWRHSSSQGDGLAFYGDLNLRKQSLVKIDKKILKDVEDDCITVTIEKVGPHMYDHYNTMKIEFDVRSGAKSKPDAIKKAEAALNEAIKTKSKALFKELADNFDANFEDSAVLEEIRANEYTFLEDGSFFAE